MTLPKMNLLMTRGLQLLLVVMIPLFWYSEHYNRAFVAALAVVFSILPALVRHNYKVTVPWFFEFIISFLLLMHLVGLYFDFYDIFWWWDKVAHLSGCAVIASLGFYGVLSLQLAGKIRLSLGMMAFVAFMLAVTIGAVWEIAEFTTDNLLGTQNQMGNTDTMIDLINDTLAAALVAIGGSWYARKYAITAVPDIDVRRKEDARP